MTCQHVSPLTKARFQFPLKRLTVRSHKVLKQRDLYLELPERAEIWQAPRQQGCRSNCQISKRCDNLSYQSRGYETSRDLTIRRLIGYWNGAQCSISSCQQADLCVVMSMFSFDDKSSSRTNKGRKSSHMTRPFSMEQECTDKGAFTPCATQGEEARLGGREINRCFYTIAPPANGPQSHLATRARTRLRDTCQSSVLDWWKSRRTSEKYGGTNKTSLHNHV